MAFFMQMMKSVFKYPVSLLIPNKISILYKHYFKKKKITFVSFQFDFSTDFFFPTKSDDTDETIKQALQAQVEYIMNK